MESESTTQEPPRYAQYYRRVGCRERGAHPHPRNQHRELLVCLVIFVFVSSFIVIHVGLFEKRYTGAVENETDSVVSLGVCQGLSGFIRTHNQTMLLEPVESNPAYPSLTHIIYPLTSANSSGSFVFQNDQDFGIRQRHKRSSIQVDYDEEGNEIVDTVRLEEMEDYSQSVDDEPDEESELSNSIDDDVIISDVYSEIDDYDVHPPPMVTEAKSLQEAEESPLNNRTATKIDDAIDVDGFSVDKLWEGMICASGPTNLKMV